MAFFEALQNSRTATVTTQVLEVNNDSNGDRTPWSSNDINFVEELQKLQEKERTFIKEGKLPIYSSSPIDNENEKNTYNDSKDTDKSQKGPKCFVSTETPVESTTPLTTRYRVLRSPHGILFRSKTDLRILGYSPPPTKKTPTTSKYLKPPKTAPELSRRQRNGPLKSSPQRKKQRAKTGVSNGSLSSNRLAVNSLQDRSNQGYSENDHNQNQNSSIFPQLSDSTEGNESETQRERPPSKPLPDISQTENYTQAILDYVETEYKVKTPALELSPPPSKNNKSSNDNHLGTPKRTPKPHNSPRVSSPSTSQSNLSDLEDNYSHNIENESVDLNMESPIASESSEDEFDTTSSRVTSRNSSATALSDYMDRSRLYLRNMGFHSHPASARSEPNKNQGSTEQFRQRSKSAHLPPVRHQKSPSPRKAKVRSETPLSQVLARNDGAELAKMLDELVVSRPEKFDKTRKKAAKSVVDLGSDDPERPWRLRKFFMVGDEPVMPDSVIPIWNKLPPGEVDYTSDCSTPPPHTVPFIETHSRRSTVRSISSVGSVSLPDDLGEGDYRPVFRRTWEEIDKITNVPPYYGNLIKSTDSPRTATAHMRAVREAHRPVYHKDAIYHFQEEADKTNISSTAVAEVVENQKPIPKSENIDDIAIEEVSNSNNAEYLDIDDYTNLSENINEAKDSNRQKHDHNNNFDNIKLGRKSSKKPARKISARPKSMHAARYKPQTLNLTRSKTMPVTNRSNLRSATKDPQIESSFDSHTDFKNGSVSLQHFVLLGKELARPNPLKPTANNEEQGEVTDAQPFMLRSKSFLKEAKEQIQRAINLKRQSARTSSKSRRVHSRQKLIQSMS